MVAVDQASLTRALADFARALVRPYSVGDVLDRLANAAVEVIDVDGAGLSIADEGGDLRFVIATDQTTAELERVQEEAQEGPCRDAFDTGQPVIVDDISLLTAYPAVTAVAVARDRRAVVGVPMRLDDQRIGTMNLYARGPRRWSDEETAAALLLVDVAAGYVLNARAREHNERVLAQLQHALESRVIIEQAKGIVAAERGITVDEAWAPIRAYARARRLKVHEVAHGIVHDGLRP